LGVAAGVADTLVIERNGDLLAGLGVLVLDGRVGPLVRNDTVLAEMHIAGQAVFDFGLRLVRIKRGEIDRFRIGDEWHSGSRWKGDSGIAREGRIIEIRPAPEGRAAWRAARPSGAGRISIIRPSRAIPLSPF